MLGNVSKKIENLRHLGGYVGKDGLKIKDDLLYRSGGLNLPEEELAAILNPLKITVVFDLRADDETKSAPYVLPQGIEYRHRPIFNSLEDQMMALNPSQAAEKSEGFSIQDVSLEMLMGMGDFLSDTYKFMAQKSHAFGDLIKEIIELEGQPLLFHCSAGKDRTGILAALLMLALGVSREDVIENYMLSNQYRKDELERYLAFARRMTDNPEVLEIIKNVLTVQEKYIEGFLASVESYPDFDSYAESCLGLKKEDLEDLREIHLDRT